MDDLVELLEINDRFEEKLEQLKKDFKQKLSVLFNGSSVCTVVVKDEVSPIETKKRKKQLSLVQEEEEIGTALVKEVCIKNESTQNDTIVNSQMAPPNPNETSKERPQRAAKSKCKANLKEPSLNQKLRQKDTRSSASTVSSIGSGDSVVILPDKPPSIVILSDEQAAEENKENTSLKPLKSERQCRIRIKREIYSIEKRQSSESRNTALDMSEEELLKTFPFKKPLNIQNSDAESSPASVTSLTSSTTQKVEKRKKFANHKPIKVERFSDIDSKRLSSISTRTRGKIADMTQKDDEKQLQPQECRAAVLDQINETFTVSATKLKATNLPTDDATFSMNAAQTTFQVMPERTTFVATNQNSKLLEATFDVVAPEKENLSQSFASAIDTSLKNSLITEDETFEVPTVVMPSLPPKPKNINNPYFGKTHKQELFNPLLESPVKKKVQVFENVAQAAAKAESTQNNQQKRFQNGAALMARPVATTTPSILKLRAQPGRFLTPILNSNITPYGAAAGMRTPKSASKIQQFPKLCAAANVKKCSTGKSADEFRKDLKQIAEERKKQREHKHILAAKLREAKDLERAERISKLAQEREEKRIKKLELEEIQRNLRLQDEAQALAVNKQKSAKSKVIVDQEREMLSQIKQQQSGSAKLQMMPPPPKTQSKYTFEMLHEDDSTDDEGKVTYKRPAPPIWGLSHERGPALLMQQYCPTEITDNFFSVQPMTPDLKELFPDIDSRHLKRNSSAFWKTPPRYSELPKY